MSLLTGGQVDAMASTFARTFDRSCTILRPQAGTDRYGNETVAVYVEVAWHVGCSLARKSEKELTEGRDTQITDWVIRLPVGTQISGRDHIEIGDITYEVVGEPEQFPTHVHVDVRHVDG